MPKMICVNCQVQYKPDVNGVYLIETAWKPPQPYKIWHSDMWICPQCKHRVVAGFGHNPLSEHYQDNFDNILAKIKEAANIGEAVVVYEWENA